MGENPAGFKVGDSVGRSVGGLVGKGLVGS